MSYHTGACGTIIIPKKIYSTLAKNLLSTYLQMQKSDYENFNTFLQSIFLKYKGKRNLNWKMIVDDEAYNHYLHNPNHHSNKPNPFQSCSVYDLVFACLDFKNPTQKPKLLKQQKFKSSEYIISFDENSISMSKDANTLSIYISYNNHSVEQAQENKFFRFVIQELKKIQWTKNTGGEIYMTQEEDENMGPSSSTHTLYKFLP